MNTSTVELSLTAAIAAWLLSVAIILTLTVIANRRAECSEAENARLRQMMSNLVVRYRATRDREVTNQDHIVLARAMDEVERFLAGEAAPSPARGANLTIGWDYGNAHGEQE